MRKPPDDIEIAVNILASAIQQIVSDSWMRCTMDRPFMRRGSCKNFSRFEMMVRIDTAAAARSIRTGRGSRTPFITFTLCRRRKR